MPNKPDPLTLLAATSKNLAERVAPSLNGAARYEVLLAISAIGTAIREIADSGERRHEEQKQLSRLLRRDETAEDCSLEALESALATAIREGQFSAEDDTEKLLDYLKKSCLLDLTVTNPKVAADYGSPHIT